MRESKYAHAQIAGSCNKELAKTSGGDFHYREQYGTKHFPIKPGQVGGMALTIFIPFHNSLHA